MNENKPLPPWAHLIPKDAFISYAPTYKVGEYFNRFKKDSFQPTDSEPFTFYYYDPTTHGYPKDKTYPLITFLHGTSNALEGDVCINYAGGEFYAKDEYQKTLGGAYLLIPLANEYRNEEGRIKGDWRETSEKKLYDIINYFIKSKMEGRCSKNILIGNSSGAWMTFKMANTYTSFFDILIPVGAGEIHAVVAAAPGGVLGGMGPFAPDEEGGESGGEEGENGLPFHVGNRSGWGTPSGVRG